MPIFYKILSLLFPKLLPQSVLFFTALTIAFLFYSWIEIYMVRYFKKEQRAALIAFALFIDIFIESIGLARQCFSSIFLLYALFAKNTHYKILFLLIATSFHLSAILVFARFYFITLFPKISLFLVMIFIVFFIQDSTSVNSQFNAIADMLKDFLNNKLYEYFKYYISSNGWNPYYYRYIPIIKTILMLCVCFSLFALCPNDTLAKYFRVIVLISFTIFIKQIFPTRSVFLITYVLFYFIVFVAFRRFFGLVLLFFFLYFLKRMYSMLVSSDVMTKESGFSVFFSYGESSFYPFYYLFIGNLQ